MNRTGKETHSRGAKQCNICQNEDKSISRCKTSLPQATHVNDIAALDLKQIDNLDMLQIIDTSQLYS